MLMTDRGNVAMCTTYEDHHCQPMYGSGMKTGFIPEPALAFKAECGVTCNYNLPPISRKRSHNSISNGCVLLNEEVASQIYQHQLEIDHFVVQHADKMRSEIGEMQRRSAKRLIVAANEGIMK
nr:hypothetical protein [Tanacetum cinerariifolium]